MNFIKPEENSYLNPIGKVVFLLENFHLQSTWIKIIIQDEKKIKIKETKFKIENMKQRERKRKERELLSFGDRSFQSSDLQSA